jgi:hypothetical protein
MNVIDWMGVIKLESTEISVRKRVSNGLLSMEAR